MLATVTASEYVAPPSVEICKYLIFFSQASEASGSPEGPAAGGHARVRELCERRAGVDMCIQVHVGACEGGRGRVRSYCRSLLDGLGVVCIIFLYFLHNLLLVGRRARVLRAEGVWPPQHRGGLDTLAATDERD